MDDRTEFLDIAFDRLDLEATLAWIAARGADTPFAYLVTPNVDHVVRLEREPPASPVRAAYRAAALCLCDSRVLARLAALAGVRLPVVPGSDLTARLFDSVLSPGERICLIGGDEAMPAELSRRWPGIEIVQHRPPMGLRSRPQAMAEAAAFAASSGARVTLLAVGSPQQELLAHAIAVDPTARGTGLCIGASVEFIVGRKARAPRWMQRAGIEWLHRLLSEPRRLWRRYLVEGPAIFLLTLRWRRRHG